MSRAVLFLMLFLAPLLSTAEEGVVQSFTDVPPGREEFTAVEDLQRRGILEGRPDGSFGPDSPVNRAEAVTIVVRAVANVRNLPHFSKCFPDVRSDDWFVGTVCYAADLDWISGYPDGTFQPARTVAKGEFLKILLNAYGVDLVPLEKFRSEPLASDAYDPAQWYFPYLSYAVGSSMTFADILGNLNPGGTLTRGQVALLLHRFLLYREGERNQILLTEGERDIRLAFEKLDAGEVGKARAAVTRVRLRAWGALQRLPEEVVVRATVKLGESLFSLTQAHVLTQKSDFPGGLKATQEAYRLADDVNALTEKLQIYTDKIRLSAHDLAESIRAHGG